MTNQDAAAFLSLELRQSAEASAHVKLDVDVVPDWFRRPSNGPGWYADPVPPIDWAAQCLAERHRLPKRVAPVLTIYILTQNADWLRGLDPLNVEVFEERSPQGDPDAFTISMRELDEFTTKADWDRIWTDYVRPRQERLWQQRGMRPQGRRAGDISRLLTVAPAYRKLVLEGLSVPEVLRQMQGDAEPVDQETIRRGIQDLDELLSPKPQSSR